MGKVDRARGKLGQRIFKMHFGMETFGVGLAYGMREIEEHVPGKLVGFGLPPRSKKPFYQGKEFDRQRGAPDQDIAFVADFDGALLGIENARGK